MEKELKSIFQQRGKAILSDPDTLMRMLTEQGCNQTQVMTLGLLLKSCPAAARILQQEKVTEAESNVLVSSAVNQTGLSVIAARRILNTVMSAADIKSAWRPRLMIYETTAEKEFTALTPDEAANLEKLEQALQAEEVSSATIHDLDVLSQKGSIRASYLLGEYFRKMDVENGTIAGQQYYQRAARMGYGPANGALADYMIRSNRKNMAKAAACFEDPTSITGHDGREWRTLAERLLSYREDNKKRTGSMLLMQGVCIMMTLLLLILGFVSAEVFGIASLVIQAISFAYLLFASMFGPYFSCKFAGYAMVLSWLSLAMAML